MRSLVSVSFLSPQRWMGRRVQHAVLGFLLAVGFMVPSAVAAQSSGPVVVLQFSGRGSDAAREAVMESLSNEGLDLFPLPRVQREAQQLGANLDSSSGRAEVAESLGLRAYVSGDVSRRGRRFRVKLSVYNGYDGEQIGVALMNVRRGALVRALSSTAADKLDSALRRSEAPTQGAPPPVARREPEPEPEVVRAPEPERRRPVREPRAETEPPEMEQEARMDLSDDEVPPGMGAEDDDVAEEGESAKRSPLWVGAGLSFLARSLRYKDSVRALADHAIDPNPAMLFQARFYPGALVTDGFASYLGLDFRFSYLLFASSRKGDQEYDTTANDLRVGLHLRLPLGAHDLGFGAGYINQAMGFEPGDDNSTAGVPEYAYQAGYVFAEGRFVLGMIALTPQLGLLFPFAYGEIGSDVWFPHMTGLGLDAALQADLALGSGVELFLAGRYRQWGLSFNPEVGDPGVSMQLQRAAGGATDRYVMIDAGVAYRF